MNIPNERSFLSGRIHLRIEMDFADNYSNARAILNVLK
jgi:hypothetical protein